MTYPFVLGTAQFGSHYGIVNSYGYPSEKDVASILNYSLEKGIRIFDTAFSYGNSLERISHIYSQNKNKKFDIINKFSVNSDLEEIYSKLLKFLEVTGLEKFYGLLIHDPQNLCSQTEKQVLSFLKRVKDNEIVDKIGVSVYAPSDLEGLLDMYPIDLIQCPLNLFDQRFLEEDVLSALKSRHIEIHARSLFLQGVLLARKLPESLKKLEPLWDVFEKKMDQYQDRLQTLINWGFSQQWIDKWVIGVASVEHFQQILVAASKYDPKNIPCFKEFRMIQNPMVDPRNWSKV